MSKSQESPRLVFMGTPLFARTIFDRLIEANFSLVAAYTRSDKPIGRGRSLSMSPVKISALEKNIPVEQPERLDDVMMQKLRSYQSDAVIVAAYGKFIPERMLDIPPFGFINVHASLLPRWRGASPLQNALLAGDTETGTTIMRIDRGMDTGPILAQRALPIAPDDTTGTLLPKLADHGADLLIETLPRWFAGEILPLPQEETGVTLCQLIEREDGRIFWNEDTCAIVNRSRALDPWPGVFSFWRRDDISLRVKFSGISSTTLTEELRPLAHGTVSRADDGTMIVRTGDGAVRIETIHLEGRNRLSSKEFLRGRSDILGTLLG